MKLIYIGVLVSFILSNGVQAQSSTSFKVAGNCDQCKVRIEKAAKHVAGVTNVDWNEQTQLLSLNYDGTIATKQAVEAGILAIGHDTEHAQASKTAYAQLPECCKYERLSVSASAKGKVETAYFKIDGMTCAEGCAMGIQTALYQQKGVKLSEVDFEKGNAKVIYNTEKISEEQLIKIIESYHGDDGDRQYKATLLLP